MDQVDAFIDELLKLGTPSLPTVMTAVMRRIMAVAGTPMPKVIARMEGRITAAAVPPMNRGQLREFIRSHQRTYPKGALMTEAEMEAATQREMKRLRHMKSEGFFQ